MKRQEPNPGPTRAELRAIRRGPGYFQSVVTRVHRARTADGEPRTYTKDTLRWKATLTPPMKLRQVRRRRNTSARVSRKANRG